MFAGDDDDGKNYDRSCSCSDVFQVENVVLEIPFPKSVLNVTLTSTQGKYSFDPVTKVMTWDVGKIDPNKLPNIKGNVSFVLESFYLSTKLQIFFTWSALHSWHRTLSKMSCI